jgi:hypothetical protein
VLALVISRYVGVEGGQHLLVRGVHGSLEELGIAEGSLDL